MCSTPSGYRVRIVQKRGAIMSLVVDKGKAMVKAGRNNGALDEDKDEDVGEVMEALRGGVGWWHKIQQGTTRSVIA